MKVGRIKMADGAEALALPGIGLAVPARDKSGAPLVGMVALLMPGMPPMPIRETLDSLEETFGERKVVI